MRGPADAPLKTTILRAEQSNSSVLYGDSLIFKLFRRPEQGINPDVEVTSYLTEKVGFAHVPPVAGTIEYHREREPIRSLAVVQGFVPNEGDAWKYALDNLSRYFEQVLARPAASAGDAALLGVGSPLLLAEREVPEAARETIGPFLHNAELLGQRTAELHRALAAATEDQNFAPEPYTQLFQRSFYQAARSLTAQTFRLLERQRLQFSNEVQASAGRLLEMEASIQDRFRSMTRHRISGLRIRVHGDYHLGQVLYTGKDFVIIDFRGRARPAAG